MADIEYSREQALRDLEDASGDAQEIVDRSKPDVPACANAIADLAAIVKRMTRAATYLADPGTDIGG